MMSSFFSVYTFTPWDNLKRDQLTQVRLLSLKSVLTSFPVVEPEFFRDLQKRLSQTRQYSSFQTIKRIVGPNNEDFNISNWNFVWAMDNDRRMFQFLFQMETEKDNKSHFILAALAPPELAKLFSEYKSDAILRTLSLLNDPTKITFLMILTPKGKSIAEEQQGFQMDKKTLEKMKFINALKKMPNIQGQWIPSFEIKCPICNELLIELQDYRIGFGKLKCPRCGYEKVK